MKTRRRARRIALEALYEIDLADHPAGEVVQRRLNDEPIDNSGAQFASKIVQGVMEYQHEMDKLISRYAPEWPLDQMAVIDRNILRIAMFEFLVDAGTPIKVAINEAVELAKTYGSDSSPRFVNGVLGTLADQVEPLRAEIFSGMGELAPA
jgi:N utilization substance protein B